MKNLLNKGKFLEEKNNLEKGSLYLMDYEMICWNCCSYDERTGLCMMFNEYVDYFNNAENCKYYFD